MTSPIWKPYNGIPGPVASGKLLLADFFRAYRQASGDNDQKLRWYFRLNEPKKPATRESYAAFLDDMRLLSSKMASGAVKSFARPFGGGDMVSVPASAWQIDSFVGRFAKSAFDPEQPLNPDAEPTHWIFVDEVTAKHAAMPTTSQSNMPHPNGASAADEIKVSHVEHLPEAESNQSYPYQISGLMRIRDVTALTGISRTTIYDMIKTGGFPSQVQLSQNIVGWYRHEVEDWLATRPRSHPN